MMSSSSTDNIRTNRKLVSPAAAIDGYLIRNGCCPLKVKVQLWGNKLNLEIEANYIFFHGLGGGLN